MISKIILTLILIGALVIYVRRRGASRGEAKRPPAAERPAEPIIPRSILYLFIGLMLAATAVILYFDWEKNYRVVTIRVINSQSGEVTLYKARRGDIEGRTFETLDGRVVTLANVERMELELGSDGPESDR